MAAVVAPIGSPFVEVNKETDDRSSHAIAYQWASKITTVSLEMVVPGALGVFVDRRLGTVVVFTLAGFIVGLSLGLVHLLRMTSSSARSESNAASDEEESTNR